MFTGLVGVLGTVKTVLPKGGDTTFDIQVEPMFENTQIGESIAVNGVCLTVETFSGRGFTAFASAETLSATNLGRLAPGRRVNLERALAFGDRLGGHLVSGHVDGVGSVLSVTPRGQSQVFRIAVPQEFSRQVIHKGSVALDGISLTVTHCGPGFLEVNIIPETQKATTIMDWRPGHAVNVETDLIGKYVQSLLTPGNIAEDTPKGGLSMDFLREHGF